MAIEMEMPIEQVQRLLGHVRFDTTLQYASYFVNQNNVKMAHKKYPDILRELLHFLQFLICKVNTALPQFVEATAAMRDGGFYSLSSTSQ